MKTMRLWVSYNVWLMGKPIRI